MPNFEFNILFLLPLLGGYLFLSTFNFTKYNHARLETQRLIFNSILTSIIFVFIAKTFDNFLIKKLPKFRIWLGNFNPYDIENLNFFLLVIVISILTALILNLISRKYFIYFSIRFWGDDYENLFYYSLRKSEIDPTKALIMLTTDSGKVYIGYINKISNPHKQHIEIIPYYSGYRDTETKNLSITTSYTEVIKKLSLKGKSELADDIGIILPKTTIISATKFNTVIFKYFSKA